MIQDRDQKELALRYSVANRWLPQLEVNIQPSCAVNKKVAVLTDLDVLTSVPDEFRGFRSIVFDCKTRQKESAINRAIWLAGILQKLKADQGFCILKKSTVEFDHRETASRLNVLLLSEEEFRLYIRANTSELKPLVGHTGQISSWEKFFGIKNRYPKLEVSANFLCSSYWAVEEQAEACRKTIVSLRNVQSELDPAQELHLCLFFNYCSLFARSLAIVTCRLFRSYLHPASKEALGDALLIMLYGGRESYEHRNELYKRVMAQSNPEFSSDLSLPEWELFLHIVRQILDAPNQLQRTPLILREAGFAILNGGSEYDFAKVLCSESPQGARFAVLVANYLCKAAKLPPEFLKISENLLMNLQPLR